MASHRRVASTVIVFGQQGVEMDDGEVVESTAWRGQPLVASITVGEGCFRVSVGF